MPSAGCMRIGLMDFDKSTPKAGMLGISETSLTSIWMQSHDQLQASGHHFRKVLMPKTLSAQSCGSVCQLYCAKPSLCFLSNPPHLPFHHIAVIDWSWEWTWEEMMSCKLITWVKRSVNGIRAAFGNPSRAKSRPMKILRSRKIYQFLSRHIQRCSNIGKIAPWWLSHLQV